MLNSLFEFNREPLAALDDGRLSGKQGVAVLSHPRSGTHLTIDLLRRNFPILSPPKPLFAPLDALYVSLDAVLIEGSDAPSVRRCVYGLSYHAIPIIKTHWVDPDLGNLAERSKALARWFDEKTIKLYIIRNPVNVFPSLHVFEREIGAVGSDRLDWLDRKSAYWARHVDSWCQRDDVMVIRFEDLIADARKYVDDIGARNPELRAAPHDPALPPPTRLLTHNRLQRLSRYPQSTEILSLKTPERFSVLFSEEERAAFRKNTEATCKRFGYLVGN